MPVCMERAAHHILNGGKGTHHGRLLGQHRPDGHKDVDADSENRIGGTDPSASEGQKRSASAAADRKTFVVSDSRPVPMQSRIPLRTGHRDSQGQSSKI